MGVSTPIATSPAARSRELIITNIKLAQIRMRRSPFMTILFQERPSKLIARREDNQPLGRSQGPCTPERPNLEEYLPLHVPRRVIFGPGDLDPCPLRRERDLARLQAELSLRPLHVAGDERRRRARAGLHCANRLCGRSRPAPSARRRQLLDRLNL